MRDARTPRGDRVSSDEQPKARGDLPPTESISVERLIPAPNRAIWQLLVDATRHADFDGSGSVRYVRRGESTLTLGSSFDMAMKIGIPYTTRSTVVEFEPLQRIAWQTFSTIHWLARFGGGRIWRYELEDTDGGTLVRETWDISREVGRSKQSAMKTRTRRYMTTNMERSLEKLDEIVGRSTTGGPWPGA
jgi:uncharacterized protein YndB with AHSA1/START domain